MENDKEEIVNVKSENVEASEQQENKISIRNLAYWLCIATSATENFLLQPSELKSLYLLLLWQFISVHHHPESENNEGKEIKEDKEIAIPEQELLRMVKLYMNKTYRPYFARLSQM